MTDHKTIIALLLEGRSYRDIVNIAGCSHRDVAAVRKTLTAGGITLERAAGMSDAEVVALFPDGRKRVTGEYDQLIPR